MYLKRLLVALIACQLMACSTYQALPNAASLSKKISDQIRINQIGYYPKATKQAVVVVDQPRSKFQVLNGNNKVVLEGSLSSPQEWDLSGETVQIADFSKVKKAGTWFPIGDDRLGQGRDRAIQFLKDHPEVLLLSVPDAITPTRYAIRP